jgi:hypothetical protein
MVAVIRDPRASAALTNGAAAEKSWAAWPPRLDHVLIMSATASSLAAIGAAATRSPVPGPSQRGRRASDAGVQRHRFDPDIVEVRLDEAGGAKFWMPPLLALELTAN